jgi:large subunit ribosomal protein L4
MELKLLNDQGQAASTLKASDALFGRDYNEALVHQVVTAYLPTPVPATASRRVA